ncbi:MAG: hypothetical protein DHS20C15_14600 [Planctomycetota bacterium]|nr:MAG: hypothetical protein DHS20C15_14600 [Planctomycetota bacterium]
MGESAQTRIASSPPLLLRESLMSRSRPVLRRAVLGLALGSLLSPSLLAQDAEALFEQGIDAYRRGDNSAAIAAFQEALAQNPGNDEAYALWQRVEQQVLLEMLLERNELGALAERFLGLAKVGRKSVLADPGGAEELVTDIFAGDLRARQRALLTMQANYGEWAVPALVPSLGDRANSDHRVKAMAALLQLGETAVPPLVATLGSEDELVRSNAAAVLGSIGDPRAAAALAWMSLRDESDTARGTASAALDKLQPALASLGLDTRDPLTLTLRLSELWVTGDEALQRPYTQGVVAWGWDGSLVGEPIPSGLYGLHMAESALQMAVMSGATGSAVRASLAAVQASKAAELTAAMDLDGMDDDAMATADDQLAALDLELALAGHYRGPALQFLLDRGAELGAVALIGAMGNSPGEMQALRAALDSGSGEVAMAAAATLGRLGEASPDVAAHLARALNAVPVRTVAFVGDAGAADAPAGWNAVGSAQVTEALAHAKAFPAKDLIVVREGAGGVTLDTLVWSLKNDPRTASTPMVIVADNVDRVEELYGDEATVLASADWGALRAAAGDRPARQLAALDRAVSAGETLLSLPAAVCRTAGNSILGALDNDPNEELMLVLLDVVRHASLTGATASVEALASNGAAGEVGVTLLNTLASLWGANGGGQPSAELVAVLHEALGSGDAELALAAANALGQRAANAEGVAQG